MHSCYGKGYSRVTQLPVDDITMVTVIHNILDNKFYAKINYYSSLVATIYNIYRGEYHTPI